MTFLLAFITSRVIRSIDYLKGREDESLGRLPLATFGASTGAAGMSYSRPFGDFLSTLIIPWKAALGAAVYRPNDVYCVVSRGGRPDLVPPNQLKDVQCPTLFLVGSKDREVLEMNQRAYECLGSHVRRVEIVPGASHLFEEQGTLELAAQHAAGFLVEHLTKAKKEWVREEWSHYFWRFGNEMSCVMTWRWRKFD